MNQTRPLPNIDDLDRAIVSLSTRINAATYELLVLIRQFDERTGWSRDKGCRFPGCTNKRFVDAHHIKHWSASGETGLGNLMLLCGRHHRLVHEGGYRIEKDYLDRWTFRRPDGIAVPTCGYRTEDSIDDNVEFTNETTCVNDSAESYLSNREKAAVLQFRLPSNPEIPAVWPGVPASSH